jgi:hypothetical protein
MGTATIVRLMLTLLLVQLLSASHGSAQEAAPPTRFTGIHTPQPAIRGQFVAVTRCLALAEADSERLARARHRHGWYYRVAEKAQGLARRDIPVVGGLLPSATLAGQAGSIDSATMARAFSGGEQQRQGLFDGRPPALLMRHLGAPCVSQ